MEHLTDAQVEVIMEQAYIKFRAYNCKPKGQMLTVKDDYGYWIAITTQEYIDVMRALEE